MNNYILPNRNTLPSGEFVCYKKIMEYKENYQGYYIVKMLVPSDAQRSCADGYKCRCSKALVLEIKNVGDGSLVDVITNTFKKNTIYQVGKYVYPDSYDTDYWKECSHGIHFFMNEWDAIRFRMSTASPFDSGYASTNEIDYTRFIDCGGANSIFVQGIDIHLDGGFADINA